MIISSIARTLNELTIPCVVVVHVSPMEKYGFSLTEDVL